MKSYKIEITQREDNSISMTRTNDGFNLAELLGFLELVRMELYAIFKQEIKVDEIKRNTIIDGKD
jgi:hypothetical protein